MRQFECAAGKNGIACSVMKWYNQKNLPARCHHMKIKPWLLMLAACAAWLMFGCAATTGAPQGSVLLGVFEGTFNGPYNDGSIEVKLYQTPSGSKPFFGYFEEQTEYLRFKGEMTGDELQGQILLPAEGTISGKLSSDGESLSGTYKTPILPFDHGTWQARKR